MKNFRKIGLFVLPFAALLASCGNESEALVKTNSSTYLCSCKSESSTKYKVMDYSIGIVTGSAKIAKTADFTAKVAGKEYKAEHLLNKVSVHCSLVCEYTFDKTIEEKDLPDNDTSSSSVNIYAAFSSDIAFDKDSEFYFQGTKVTSTASIIKVK